MNTRLAIHVVRGELLESRHRIDAVVSDARGEVVLATADPGLMTSFRSAAKPFQLAPFVERGHAERWGLDDEALALMAASHSGSAWHVERVGRLLERLGLAPDQLACGFHKPFDHDSAALLRAHPERRSTLYNNCSGKHAGMLGLALAEGWPLEGYTRPDHPVQRLMRESVAAACGLAPAALATGIDGCSVVAFGAPLGAIARAYASLAVADPRGGPRERALARIRDAMRAHPRATSGAGRFSASLMEAAGGRLVSKVGAEALECVAIPERGWGVAVKVADGAGRATGPATVALLARLGVLSQEEQEPLARWARPVTTNHAGLEVGTLEAVWDAPGPA
jgi:L-asparaginase II